MSELRGACIIAQSGGPTAVINASALGVIRTALDSDCITRVLGAAYGIKGVLEDKLYDMGQEDPGELELLRSTPASVLGSCRYKLADPEGDDTDYRRILEIFQRYDVRYFFYNGGNDSMDTCNKISRYMRAQGYECRIIGVPKTIDNDLNGTDHCPGYGSAAKYIATSCAEVWHDAHVYDTGTITIIEIMGRHAGWLAGSAALAGLTGCGPDLLYLPPAQRFGALSSLCSSGAAPTSPPRLTLTRPIWLARRRWRPLWPEIPERWWPSAAPGRAAIAARPRWSRWISWRTSRKRFPADGSTPPATAWSSPSSTTPSPSSRGRPITGWRIPFPASPT